MTNESALKIMDCDESHVSSAGKGIYNHKFRFALHYHISVLSHVLPYHVPTSTTIFLFVCVCVCVVSVRV